MTDARWRGQGKTLERFGREVFVPLLAQHVNDAGAYFNRSPRQQIGPNPLEGKVRIGVHFREPPHDRFASRDEELISQTRRRYLKPEIADALLQRRLILLQV